MESLRIEGDKKSPKIIFEPYSGVMVMKGRSSLENPTKFFAPVLEWAEKYTIEPSKQTIFRMQMEYFNSSSSKVLMKIFRIMEAMHKGGKSNFTIEWFYEELDGSMLEAGEDFQSMLKGNFKYMPHSD